MNSIEPIENIRQAYKNIYGYDNFADFESIVRPSPVIAGIAYPNRYRYRSRSLWLEKPYNLNRKWISVPKWHRRKKPKHIAFEIDGCENTSNDPQSYLSYSPVIAGASYKPQRDSTVKTLYNMNNPLYSYYYGLYGDINTLNVNTGMNIFYVFLRLYRKPST